VLLLGIEKKVLLELELVNLSVDDLDVRAGEGRYAPASVLILVKLELGARARVDLASECRLVPGSKRDDTYKYKSKRLYGRIVFRVAVKVR
jgi:hypothetical protein